MKKIVLFLFVMTIQFCFSQEGDIDLSFHPTDRGNGYGDGVDGPAAAGGCTIIGLQPDGNMLLTIGSSYIYNGKFEKSLLRVNPDGEADSSFNQGLTGPMFGEVYTGLLLADGKIIIGGTFTNYNGTAINRIARLNSNGTLDATFNPGTGANADINSLAILPNGKIVIGGSFTLYNGVQRNRIAVLNEDGSLDTGFNPNSGASSAISKVAALSDGKILISGYFNYYNVTPISNGIVRINSDGAIDATFAPAVVFRTFKVLSDGKILGIISGSVIKLNATGTVDSSFNYGIAEYAVEFYPLPDGKLIVSVSDTNGTSTSNDDQNKLVRLNVDGSLDNSFNMVSGIPYYVPGDIGGGIFYTFAIQPDGRLLAGGNFIFCGGKVMDGITRFNSDGSYDANFNAGTGADDEVQSIAILPDGKMAVSGAFREYNDVLGRTIILNTDGSLNAVMSVSSIRSMASQSDGKILVAGNFTLAGTGVAPRYFLKRCNTDGTIDTSFNFTLAGTDAYDVVVLPDDKILVAGKFAPSYDNRVIRLNADGSVDTTFNQNVFADSYVYDIAVQADGKILVAGGFTTYGGIPEAKMARLEANGTIDTTFNVGVGFTNTLEYPSVTVQPDGKILLIGNYPNFGGVERKIVRLNSGGSIDMSFNVGSGPSDRASTLALQGDGKVLVGGYFTTFNGQAKNYLVRLNSNGSIDNSFNTVGTGANNNIKKIVILPDGKPLIAGSFINYNGVGRNRIARLNPVVLATDEFNGSHQNVSVYPNPVKDVLHLEHHTTIQSIAVFDLLGKLVIQKNINPGQAELDMSELGSALYFVKVATADGIQNFKIVKE